MEPEELPHYRRALSHVRGTVETETRCVGIDQRGTRRTVPKISERDALVRILVVFPSGLGLVEQAIGDFLLKDSVVGAADLAQNLHCLFGTVLRRSLPFTLACSPSNRVGIVWRVSGAARLQLR